MKTNSKLKVVRKVKMPGQNLKSQKVDNIFFKRDLS